MQNNQNILWGIIGLLAGIIVGVAVAGYGVNSGNTQMMRMMGMGKGAQMMQNGVNGQNMMDEDDVQNMMNNVKDKSSDKSSSITPEQHLAHHKTNN